MKTRLLGLTLKDFKTLIKGDNRKTCYHLFLFKPNRPINLSKAITVMNVIAFFILMDYHNVFV